MKIYQEQQQQLTSHQDPLKIKNEELEHKNKQDQSSNQDGVCLWIVVGVGMVLVILGLGFWYSHNQKQVVKNSNDNSVSQKRSSFKKERKVDQNQYLYDENEFQDLGNHLWQKQHLHPIKKIDRATLGVPVPGHFFNYTKVCPSDFRNYEKQLDQLFKPYNDTNCEHAIFGSQSDQSYILCKNFIPHSQVLLNLGLQGKDTFGCHISSNYNITYYLYDTQKDYQYQFCQSRQPDNFFNKIFGDKVEFIADFEYTTLQNEIKYLKIQNKSITIKMDIEGAQWTTLRYLPIQMLDNIDQIVFQVHLPYDRENDAPYWGNIDIINSLKKYFVSVNLHLNNFGALQVQKFRKQSRYYPAKAFEVTLVNKKLIKINKKTRAYPQKVPNIKNNIDAPQLFMIDWK